MCFSNVCMNSVRAPSTIMKDAARMGAEAEGYWFIDRHGQRISFKGRVQSTDRTDRPAVILTGGWPSNREET